MKAAVIQKHGDADVLEFLDWPESGPAELYVHMPAKAREEPARA